MTDEDWADVLAAVGVCDPGRARELFAALVPIIVRDRSAFDTAAFSPAFGSAPEPRPFAVSARRLTDEQVDALLTRRRQGVSLRALASEYDVSVKTVRKYLERGGLAPVAVLEPESDDPERDARHQARRDAAAAAIR